MSSLVQSFTLGAGWRGEFSVAVWIVCVLLLAYEGTAQMWREHRSGNIGLVGFISMFFTIAAVTILILGVVLHRVFI